MTIFVAGPNMDNIGDYLIPEIMITPDIAGLLLAGLVDYAVAEGEALKKAIEIASKIVTKVRPLWIKCWPKFP